MLIKRNLPKNFEKSHKIYFEILKQIEIATPYLKHHGFSLLIDNGVLLNWKGFCSQSLLYDSRLHEKLFLIRIIKYLIKKIFSGNLSIRCSRKIKISVINEWTNNYFHWLTEALPRLIFVKEYLTNFQLLLPESYKQYQYVLESLRILEIEVDWFPDGVIFLNKLLIPSRQAPFPAHYNPEYILKVNNAIVHNLILNFQLGDRIYISRRNAKMRKIKNEDEVISLITLFGFKVVECEKLSFNEQVSVFYNARVLMSIHGAGLTNMLFGKKGMIVYEFSLENQSLDKCYYTLADALQHKYFYQFCKSDTKMNSYQDSNLIVDLDTLRNQLTKLFTP
jgi:hypothetical protein